MILPDNSTELNKQMNNLPLSTQPTRKVCPKCGQFTETVDTKCRRCGKTLQTVKAVKIMGAMLLLIGAALLVSMSWLSVWMYNVISQSGQPGAQTEFTGSPQMILFIVFIFGLVMTFGLFATLQGIRQIIYGKRSKLLTIIILVLGGIFMLIGLIIEMRDFHY